MAETQASAALQGVTFEGSDLASLLQKEFKPATEERRSRIEQTVQTLAEQALSNAQIVGGDVFATVDAMRHGIVTTTSLMACCPWAWEAMQMLRDDAYEFQ